VKQVIITILLSTLLWPASLLALPRDRLGNQRGSIVVGVVHDPPYIIKTKTGEWTGLNVDLWKGVSQELKVDYVF
jgi:ABC-type amino acid transport substrate-binding protein